MNEQWTKEAIRTSKHRSKKFTLFIHLRYIPIITDENNKPCYRVFSMHCILLNYTNLKSKMLRMVLNIFVTTRYLIMITFPLIYATHCTLIVRTLMSISLDNTSSSQKSHTSSVSSSNIPKHGHGGPRKQPHIK